MSRGAELLSEPFEGQGQSGPALEVSRILTKLSQEHSTPDQFDHARRSHVVTKSEKILGFSFSIRYVGCQTEKVVVPFSAPCGLHLEQWATLWGEQTKLSSDPILTEETCCIQSCMRELRKCPHA